MLQEGSLIAHSPVALLTYKRRKKMNTIWPEIIFAAMVFAILFSTGVLIW